MRPIRKPSIDSLKPEREGSSLYPVPNMTVAELERRIENLRVEVTSALETVSSVKNDLDTFISDSGVAITTNTLNATSIISENLNTVSATLRAILATTIETNSITAAEAAIDNITGLLANLQEVVATRVSTDNLIANEALVDALTVTDLIVQGSQTFQNLFISNLNAGNANISSTTTERLDSRTAGIMDLSVSGSADIADANISKLSVGHITGDATIDSLDIGEITHTQDYITITNDYDSLVVSPPFFENGFYQLIAIDEENTPIFAIELHNDIRNDWFSWSREIVEGVPYLELVRFFNVSKYPRAYFKINTHGKTLKVYYTCNSYDTKPLKAAPETYETFPFSVSDEGVLTYLITRDNGIYFANQVDIVQGGDEHLYADLRLSSTDSFSITGSPTTYNGVVDRSYIVYRPDQSLNTDDRVTHLSVEAPFLGIADASVATRFTAPNIYNGPRLASTANLEDETLYIPIDVLEGVTVPGIELLRDGEVDKYFSSSATKLVSGKSFLQDEYKPENGYILSEEGIIRYTKALAAINDGDDYSFNNYLLRNDNNGTYYFVSPVVGTSKGIFTIKAADLAIAEGQLATGAGLKIEGPAVGVYKDATMEEEIFDVFGPFTSAAEEPIVLQEGISVYITTEDPYMPNGSYSVIRNAVGFATTNGLPYTKNNGGGRLYRKKGTTTLPLIPYREVEE